MEYTTIRAKMQIKMKEGKGATKRAANRR